MIILIATLIIFTLIIIVGIIIICHYKYTRIFTFIAAINIYL